MAIVYITSWDLAHLQLPCSELVACLAVRLNRFTDVLGPQCGEGQPACLTAEQHHCCFVKSSSCLLVCLQGSRLMVFRSHLLVRSLACRAPHAALPVT